MSRHHAEVRWTATEGEDFLAGRYSRLHQLRFGAVTVPGSASPSVVPAPWSTPDAVDPEAAFVASLSACHMLWFLDLARRAGLEVASYRDAAVGTMARDERGRMAMTRIVLRPEIAFAGRRPDAPELERLHHQAHESCFIANSLRTEVVVEAP